LNFSDFRGRDCTSGDWDLLGDGAILRVHLPVVLALSLQFLLRLLLLALLLVRDLGLVVAHDHCIRYGWQSLGVAGIVGELSQVAPPFPDPPDLGVRRGQGGGKPEPHDGDAAQAGPAGVQGRDQADLVSTGMVSCDRAPEEEIVGHLFALAVCEECVLVCLDGFVYGLVRQLVVGFFLEGVEVVVQDVFLELPFQLRDLLVDLPGEVFIPSLDSSSSESRACRSCRKAWASLKLSRVSRFLEDCLGTVFGSSVTLR